MKVLKNLVDNVKPSFEKGGKLSAFHSLFDALETFLFVPSKVTSLGIGCHVRDSIDMKRTMIIVVIAAIPALLFGMWNVGYQHFGAIGATADFWQQFWYGFLKVLPIIIVSYVSGLFIEVVWAQIKGHEVQEGFFVSGFLIPLIMPVETPLWMIAIATMFAVVFGKEVFGGTGMNIVNIALLARAFLFFSYPQDMSGENVWIALDKGDVLADGVTGATPLGNALVGAFDKVPTFWDSFWGFIPGSIGETSTFAILIGAVILLFTGVASWKIMLSTLLGATGVCLLFNALGAEGSYLAFPWYDHLVLGGFAFGMVFMATDPVTAAQTETGKWIYGALIGIFAMVFRVLNPAYPEGMMLAILLMNVFAPLIDYYVVDANVNRRLKRAKLFI